MTNRAFSLRVVFGADAADGAVAVGAGERLAEGVAFRQPGDVYILPMRFGRIHSTPDDAVAAYSRNG